MSDCAPHSGQQQVMLERPVSTMSDDAVLETARAQIQKMTNAQEKCLETENEIKVQMKEIEEVLVDLDETIQKLESASDLSTAGDLKEQLEERRVALQDAHLMLKGRLKKCQASYADFEGRKANTQAHLDLLSRLSVLPPTVQSEHQHPHPHRESPSPYPPPVDPSQNSMMTAEQKANARIKTLQTLLKWKSEELAAMSNEIKIYTARVKDAEIAMEYSAERLEKIRQKLFSQSGLSAIVENAAEEKRIYQEHVEWKKKHEEMKSALEACLEVFESEQKDREKAQDELAALEHVQESKAKIEAINQHQSECISSQIELDIRISQLSGVIEDLESHRKRIEAKYVRPDILRSEGSSEENAVGDHAWKTQKARRQLMKKLEELKEKYVEEEAKKRCLQEEVDEWESRKEKKACEDCGGSDCSHEEDEESDEDEEDEEESEDEESDEEEEEEEEEDEEELEDEEVDVESPNFLRILAIMRERKYSDSDEDFHVDLPPRPHFDLSDDEVVDDDEIPLPVDWPMPEYRQYVIKRLKLELSQIQEQVDPKEIEALAFHMNTKEKYIRLIAKVIGAIENKTSVADAVEKETSPPLLFAPLPFVDQGQSKETIKEQLEKLNKSSLKTQIAQAELNAYLRDNAETIGKLEARQKQIEAKNEELTPEEMQIGDCLRDAKITRYTLKDSWETLKKTEDELEGGKKRLLMQLEAVRFQGFPWRRNPSDPH